MFQKHSFSQPKTELRTKEKRKIERKQCPPSVYDIMVVFLRQVLDPTQYIIATYSHSRQKTNQTCSKKKPVSLNQS